MTKQQTLWGIHGGATGDADSLFFAHNVVAIGWPNMGDLSPLADRDAFKLRYTEVLPGKSTGHVNVNAGQLFRFAREIEIGDFVIYPSKATHQVHIGSVTGGYAYRPEVDADYPHQRPIAWMPPVPRTVLSPGALSEIGAAMSLFQINTYADEFRAVLASAGKGTAPTTAAEENDPAVALAMADTEEQTRDFILRRLSQNLKGLPFEDFAAHLLPRFRTNG